MADREPVAALDARFSSADASPMAWAEARGHLEQAELFWISTVRPDGQPHVTPLIAVWFDGAFFGDGDEAWVFEVVASTAFAFAKGGFRGSDPLRLPPGVTAR
jgi:Pyridoxamine 5'-phosphate oxidase